MEIIYYEEKHFKRKAHGIINSLYENPSLFNFKFSYLLLCVISFFFFVKQWKNHNYLK